jgi:hypothetical protein
MGFPCAKVEIKIVLAISHLRSRSRNLRSICDLTDHPDSYRFEQAFSEDGKDWEVNWIAIDKKINSYPPLYHTYVFETGNEITKDGFRLTQREIPRWRKDMATLGRASHASASAYPQKCQVMSTITLPIRLGNKHNKTE